MAKRLVIIAKQLNVGTTTIVEHLNNSGFEIENKPIAKISDEMYSELLKHFSNEIAVKEKADKLTIGHRPPREEVEEKPVFHIDVVKAPVVPKPPVEPAAKVIADTPGEVAAPVEKKEEKAEGKPTIKLVGKIDLEAINRKKEKPAPEPKKAVKEPEKAPDPTAKAKPEVKDDSAAVKPEKVEGEQAKTAEPEASPPPVKKTEELLRAVTPKLKGLKVLGKIDASKLAKPKPKQDDKKQKTAAGTSASDARKRRKRKRRKITPQDVRSVPKKGAPKRKGGRDDIKEVSKKEIEDKIKATMARIQRGGKSKRQKIRRDSRDKKAERRDEVEVENETKAIDLTEFVSVSELANLMDVSVTDVITTCMNLGVIVSINQRLDAEVIELLADEYNHEINFITAEEQTLEIDDEEDAEEDLLPRAPIVTVMGHVDHGKTSLLDFIRNANVAESEAGGITQHIGAYEVEVGADNKRITFLDTPGHEAFTAMRARGAKVTDIAVIIVAADDRIMPQTKEAISHAQAAGVPMVFAINKIDKDGADPERVKQELSSMNILVEDWGGKFQSQDISAKTGENIDQLLEKILLEAEMLDLKANPDRNSLGTVLEASLDKGRGYVTKVLVQNGTLNIGDTLVAGEHPGKVKAMYNERGQKVMTAGPSQPVLILGMDGAPQAGEIFRETDDEPQARQIATQRAQIAREQTNRATKRLSLDEIGRRLALGDFKELKLIVKGDVDGSVEALSDSLIKLSVDTVGVSVIHKAVGQIIESDVLLASASDAIIIGFQVRPSLGARKLAEKEGIQIKTYSVIYEAIDEIKSAIEGMLEPTREEKITGQVEVREIYKISRIGTIAGCYVLEGKISRNSHIRLIRDGIVTYPTKEGVVGAISSLKRYKEDVKEVKFGIECGITIKNFNDIKVGDVIETYEIEEIKRTL
ncbi:MAG: translation initiation factor IF-2 [Bacteroidetes bacterium]|nr:MAG: translation initiation factor IF-2 [Bacteroidota bacterium]